MSAGGWRRVVPLSPNLDGLVTSSTGIRGSSTRRGRRRRLPAFGRRILSLRRQGLAPDLAVLILDGWTATDGLGLYAPWVVVVPDDCAISEIDFRCIAGLHVVVQATHLERVDAIASKVLSYAPRAVFGWPDKHCALIFYIEDTP